MSINNRAPASGELLKTDGSIINQADVLSDVYDAEAHAVKTVLQAEGVTFEVNETDLTAVREAVEAQAKLTDTQPAKIDDDAFALISAPIIKRQSIATTASQVVLTDDAGVAIQETDISAIRIHNLGATDLYIGTVSTLTTAAKSDRISPDGEMTLSFQRGSSAASAIWFIREAATEDIAVTIVRWD